MGGRVEEWVADKIAEDYKKVTNILFYQGKIRTKG
jgi:hypothetical protein